MHMAGSLVAPLLSGAEVSAQPAAYLLIDVRTPEEFGAGHIPGSINMPLGDLGGIAPAIQGAGRQVVFVCRTGKRATTAYAQLSQQGLMRSRVLDGGIIAWSEAGFPVIHTDPTLSIERQVRIVAGVLVALGTGLGVLIHPAFLLMPGVVGTGLVVAGITDTCALAGLLARLPWNRARQATRCAAVEGRPPAQEQRT
jgi:rhodanese-related sulfurtransferase